MQLKEILLVFLFYCLLAFILSGASTQNPDKPHSHPAQQTTIHPIQKPVSYDDDFPGSPAPGNFFNGI